MEDRLSRAGVTALNTLAKVEVSDGLRHQGMVLFAAFSGGVRSLLAYRTLTEALAEGWVEVTEQAQATVPELRLVNRGKLPILVIDGEEIVGGRQNRIVNKSFLIDAGTAIDLPVTCVEHGRWHETAPRFSAGESAPASLRNEKFDAVTRNLRGFGRAVADQNAIWDGVAAREAASGSRSPSEAMHAIYEKRGDDLATYLEAFPYPRDAVGLVVALNGHLTGAEVFDQTRTAELLWPKLIRGYALDAIGGRIGLAVGHDRAIRFLARTHHAHCDVFPSLGLGEEVRLTGDGLVGSVLVHAGTLVHASLFRRRVGG